MQGYRKHTKYTHAVQLFRVRLTLTSITVSCTSWKAALARSGHGRCQSCAQSENVHAMIAVQSSFTAVAPIPASHGTCSLKNAACYCARCCRSVQPPSCHCHVYARHDLTSQSAPHQTCCSSALRWANLLIAGVQFSGAARAMRCVGKCARLGIAVERHVQCCTLTFCSGLFSLLLATIFAYRARCELAQS